jgi:hypothetical protein
VLIFDNQGYESFSKVVMTLGHGKPDVIALRYLKMILAEKWIRIAKDFANVLICLILVI